MLLDKLIVHALPARPLMSMAPGFWVPLLMGEKARQFYADDLSPMLGADRNGPTAIVLSCGNLDFSNCAGGEVLDMKFHPSALASPEGRSKFSALIKNIL